MQKLVMVGGYHQTWADHTRKKLCLQGMHHGHTMSRTTTQGMHHGHTSSSSFFPENSLSLGQEI